MGKEMGMRVISIPSGHRICCNVKSILNSIFRVMFGNMQQCKATDKRYLESELETLQPAIFFFCKAGVWAAFRISMELETNSYSSFSPSQSFFHDYLYPFSHSLSFKITRTWSKPTFLVDTEPSKIFTKDEAGVRWELSAVARTRKKYMYLPERESISNILAGTETNLAGSYNTVRLNPRN